MAIPRVRGVDFFVQVFARVMREEYAVGVIEAHSSCHGCAADNAGGCVLGGYGIVHGRGVRGCGRGGCG